MKTLHVHIGTPKTGTTAIQFFLKENEQILEKNGYCYPILPFSYPLVSKKRNGHFLVGRKSNDISKRDINQEKQIFQDGMQKICELFETYDNIILTDESIWRDMDVFCKNLWSDLAQNANKNGFSIHVIVYLRRQDKFICSHWNQQLKMKVGPSTELPFEDYLAKINKSAWLKYYTKLERMAEVIGKNNITVRRFDPNTFVGGSIYSDILSALGLSITEEYKISQAVRNSGLYGNTHELKRVLNGLPQMEEKPIQDFIRDRLLECSDQSAADYPCEMFSKEETITFLAQFEEENNRIAQEYLHEPNGQLFDNTVKDSPKWQKDNPYMLDDLTRFVGTTAIWLYQENQQMKKQIKHMEKQIHDLQKQPKTPPQTAPAPNPAKRILRRVKRALTTNSADTGKTVENN